MKIPRLYILLLTLITATTAQAQLTWETTRQTDNPDYSDTQTIARFPFKNETDKTINITKIESNCSCTVGDMDDREISPGETGEITAVFDYGNRTGPQRKIITVHTDSPEQPRATLILELTIPELLTTQPRFVFWRVGETPGSKSVTLTLATPDAKIETISPSEHFTAVLEPVSDGAPTPGSSDKTTTTYTLTITPESTDSRAASKITLSLSFPPDITKQYILHAQVK